MKKLTINEFIEKASKIHNNFYDYSKFIYTKSNIKGIILCKNHGEFKQSPNSHLRRSGCPKCGFKKSADACRGNRNDFIEKSKKIHGKKYDYSKVDYKRNNKVKVEIICKTHGSFFQTPNNHFGGNGGCPTCARNITLSYIIGNTQKFINDAKKIHGNKYDYSKVNYFRSNKKVEIICKTHGSFFQQPNNHLNGTECPKCGCQISRSQTEFLDYLKIENQNVFLEKWKRKKVDGYDSKTNTVYEFLGDYYHGNPNKYNPLQYNQICHKTFGELYKETFDKLGKLKKMGYNIKYIWENDWNKFKKKETNIPSIMSF